MRLLHDAFRHPVDLKPLLCQIQLRENDIHELPDIGSFQDDVVSVFSEHLVDQRRGGVDFDIFQSILFFEVEEVFVQGVDFGEETLFDFVLIQNHAEFAEGRIAVGFSEEIILLVEFRFIQLARGADAVLVGIE